VALLLVSVASEARAQTSADFFDNSTLQDVQLFINTRDLAQLRQRYDENTYYTADFVWRGMRIRNVGVRVRGVASRSAVKPGLRIDFNRYISTQRFLGLGAVVLDNLWNDPAMIREHTSMAFINRMGEPAPREAMGRLFINGTYQGVYALVEAVDENFLQRTIGESDGYLFDYKFTTSFYAQDLGDDLNAYKPRFEPKTHRLESDTAIYLPIRNLFLEANHDMDSVWRDRVSEYIDLEQMVSHVAVETFLSEDDGFLGGAGMANFYVYRPAGSNRHRLFPWDRDSTFTGIDTWILQRVDTNILFLRALQFADLRALYFDVLERCARMAVDDQWLEAQLAQTTNLIREAAYRDTAKRFSNDDYDQAVDFLMQFARERSASVLRQIAETRR